LLIACGLLTFMLKSIMSDNKSRLVYSTAKIIPRKESTADKTHHVTTHASQKSVYVRLERKGRGGKCVTLIEGLQISAKDLETLLKQLKTRLGTGGALKSEILEIQGDHREAIMAMLQDMGYRPKRSGG
jgi:translation initiation factor 1